MLPDLVNRELRLVQIWTKRTVHNLNDRYNLVTNCDEVEQLDGKTADFLRTKERNMREIVGRAYTELGRELKEAQDALANHNKYEGVFEKWYNAIGFKRDAVYRLIRRYDVIANCEDMSQRELLEDLPVSLSYEIAAPSAESTEPKRQAKRAVLNFRSSIFRRST